MQAMERTPPEEVTQGTLEGDLIPGDITFFRLQSTADNILRRYIAQGETLPVATRSFHKTAFGKTKDEKQTHLYTFENKKGMQMKVANFGATLPGMQLYTGVVLNEKNGKSGVDYEEIDGQPPVYTIYAPGGFFGVHETEVLEPDI